MAIYYFDVQLKGEMLRDEYGDEFDTIEEAADQAQALLFELVRAHPLWDAGMIACEVRDDQGRAWYRAEITFRSLDVSR